MTSYSLYYKNEAFYIVQINTFEGNKSAFVVETHVGTYEEALKKYEKYFINNEYYWSSFGVKLS